MSVVKSIGFLFTSSGADEKENRFVSYRDLLSRHSENDDCYFAVSGSDESLVCGHYAVCE